MTAETQTLPAAAAAIHVGRLGVHARWKLLLAVLCGLIVLPIAALVVLALGGSGEVWPHLARHVLPRALANTGQLLACIGLLTGVIGVACAWLVTMCRFPGRSAFAWLLLLPLAMPTYVSAYAYVEILGYTGPVQSVLRGLFGWQRGHEYWFPEIRTLPGCALVMSLVLYPYVYLTVRASFLMQTACVLDVSRTLGQGAWGTFWRIALPLARPAIAIGLALALMEALNDLGATRFFGIETLTVSVYATWLNRGSLAGAAQIALFMLVIVLALVALERFARRRQRFFPTSSRARSLPAYELRGWRAAFTVTACALPVALGFAAPAALLADYALARFDSQFDAAFLGFAGRSLGLSLAGALVTVAIGLLIAYAQRLSRSPAIDLAARFAALGYALPGTVLAIGILYPLAAFDNGLDALMRQGFGISTGLLLTGSAFALVYAYSVRFMAVSYGTIEAGMQRITPHLDMAARSLGRTAGATLREIHLPLVRPALVSAAILVFVDCMKELPATILLRPFGFETLATHVFAAASRESFEDGALAALTIVAVGLLPVVLLARTARLPMQFVAAKARSRSGGA